VRVPLACAALAVKLLCIS